MRDTSCCSSTASVRGESRPCAALPLPVRHEPIARWSATRERADRFGVAIGFYPGGCTAVLRDSGWRPSSPLLLQLGAADNYTLPQPCVDLASRARARRSDEVEVDLHAGAYHLFDHPSMPTHPFTRIVFRDGSSPMIGSDPAARARAIERVKTYLRTHLPK